MKQYYSAVYADDRGKVMQISDDIDSLSCEALAEPGVNTTRGFTTVAQMVKTAKEAAHFLMCHHLEINCSRGLGSYQWLRIS